MSIITLTTDFGLKDGHVALIKGVIWRIAPLAQITDISHLIQPQNILEASLILYNVAPHFPDGTIHVIVVEQRGGTNNRPIAVKLKSHYFVCFDNGVLSLLFDLANEQNWPIECFHLTNSHYWLSNINLMFHGCDVFAPVAAHLANGKDVRDFGSPVTDIQKLHFPYPQVNNDSIQGEIIYIDHFGNIVTNILEKHLKSISKVSIKLCGIELTEIVQTFEQHCSGELLALYIGTRHLIISMVNGNAAITLNAQIGQSVEIRIT
jgi:S-adenosyl-L-methionine hydrolase (adenosine-forming)